MKKRRDGMPKKGFFKIIIARSADPKDEILEKEFELVNDVFWSGV